jgi:hypothetical protein
MRTWTSISAIVAVASLIPGCGDQFTTQEAYAACEELIVAGPAGDPPELFAECVACHEDCGSSCERKATTPARFECPLEE